jgi:hypothetical protein
MPKLHDVNSQEAQIIYETLERNYPLELRNIQRRQADDMKNLGHLSPKTEAMLDQLMDRVVSDNHRLGRTNV